MPASTIALCNLKGGVGKTSTTFHLAGTMAKEGRRVLLLDVDPQASLTQGFFGPDAMRALPRESTIAALFGDGMVPEPAELIRPTGFAGVSIVPGSGHLTRHNVPEPWLCERDQQRALRDFTTEVRGHFDVHFVRLPSQPPLVCVGGADGSRPPGGPPPGRGLRQSGDRRHPGVRRRRSGSGTNPELHLAGYLLTMFNPRLAIHRAYESMLRQLYGESVLTTTIPIGADFKEAVAIRKPIVEHKPRGASAKSIKALADELLARVTYTVQGEAPDDSRRVA